MNKKTKRLLLAISLLLVSAILLGTASFAWFSMNTEVAVDGVEVEAYSDALFLQIANENTPTAFGTETNFNSTKESLRLVTQIRVNTSALKTLTATAESGAPDEDKDYYKKGDATSAADTYAADNYILVDAFDAATALDDYYRIEFVATANNATAVTGVDYYEKLANGNGYKAVEVTYEDAEEEIEADSVYGLYVAYSYVVTEDEDFVEGTTYYVLNANREFTEVNFGEDDEMEEDVIYFEKVAGIEALGAGVYTDADDTNAVAYYTTETVDNGTDSTDDDYDIYVIATDLAPAETVDGLYTLEATDAVATAIAAGAKVWWENASGDYLCVYHNTSSTAADIKDNIFWGKAYSDALDAVQKNAREIGIIKEASVSNYVYKDTLYLRSALNTNDGKNLRIENIEVGGRANALSEALRICFVATNGAGDVATYTYDNGREFTANTLFNTILGDARETVSVDVYIFFDGTDDVAKTTTGNAVVLNGQTIAIEFAIDGVDYSVNP